MLKQVRAFSAGAVLGGLLVSGAVFASPIYKTISAFYDDIKIFVNGNEITPKDASGVVVEPFIVDGTTYLPARAVSEALGAKVQWDGNTKRIDIENTPMEIEEIKVSTGEEFIQSLGSNRKIILAPGVYNLSKLKQMDTYDVQIRWEEVYDGYELWINGISNLTIVGASDEKSEIIVEPRYAFVLKFANSSNIIIQNITAGHTDAGSCQGGVFAFENCRDIAVDNAHLYGSGTEGFQLVNVTNMKVTDTTIYECTYGIMTVSDSENISFNNCTFKNNREFDLLSISNTSGFVIDNSTFQNNSVAQGYGRGMFLVSKKSNNVVIRNSKFLKNDAELLSATAVTSDSIVFENNVYEGNKFDKKQ